MALDEDVYYLDISTLVRRYVEGLADSGAILGVALVSQARCSLT